MMVRRVFIFVLVMGLLALEPGMVSLCASLAQSPADCAAPMSSECDRMGMEQTASLECAPASGACCRVSSAPVPEAQARAIATDLAPAGTALGGVVRLPENFQRTPSKVSSPPELQSLLCTFRI